MRVGEWIRRIMFDRKAYDKQYRIDNKEKRKEYMKQWTLDNREDKNEYNKQWRKNNPEHKKQWREDNPEKRKEHDKRYRKNNFEKIEQYRINNRGKHNKHNRKYNKTEKGEINSQRNDFKRRELGFNPLNQSFEDSEGHHINKNDVIYMPKAIHRGIVHCLKTGKNMMEINRLAIRFL